MTEHPARQKARLRELLAADRTLTTAQLHRRGLLSAAGWLDLPQRTLTCRTRTTQPHSATDLTFVALDGVLLARPARDLMHDAGLAEARDRMALPEGSCWAHVTLAGRGRHHLPDAEVTFPGRRPTGDWAVEFDAGYSPALIEKKLRAAALAGYDQIIWATTIHARTARLLEQARELDGYGLLPGVRFVTTIFVDVWSRHDPYGNRPRCHKLMWESLSLARAGPAAG